MACDSPPDEPYEVMPSDIRLEWFLAGLTPEIVRRDLLPPEGTAERARVEGLLYQREYAARRRNQDGVA